MKKALTSLALMGAVAYGATVDQNVTFQFTGDTGCTISNSPSLSISFNGLTDASGQFSVQFLCSPSTSYTLSVEAGANSDATSRRAVNGADYIRYRLYWDNGYTQEIGVNANNTQTGTGNGNTQTQTIYARVLANENANAPLGTYTDTLRVKITW